VWGREHAPVARGGASTWRFDDPPQTPIPRGMVWNQVYDEGAFAAATPESRAQVSLEALWQRYETFLEALLPVAEESGVKLALHPEDPPLPELRGSTRLVHRPELYDRALRNPSSSNCMALCIGTLSEVPDSDVYAAIDRLSSTGRIAYMHFRNVKGHAPHYDEAFVDDGDTDMLRVLQILVRNGYQGLLVPDHTPELTCDAPWHAGMAYALGWMRASLSALGALG
jgi:mannonate dehydratase